jgi:hypothetical protein
VKTDGTIARYAGTVRWGNQIDPNGDPTQTQLTHPKGVVELSDKRVLITETWNHRVLVVKTDGTIALYAGTGRWGNHIDQNGNPTQTQLTHPKGVVELSDRRVLIVDSWNHRVLVIKTDGTIARYAGTNEEGNQIDPDGDPTQTQLNRPMEVVELSNGNILINDKQNHRVLCVTEGTTRQDELELAELVREGKIAAAEWRYDDLQTKMRSLLLEINKPIMFSQRGALEKYAYDENREPLTTTWLGKLPPESFEKIREYLYNPKRDLPLAWCARAAYKNLTTSLEYQSIPQEIKMQIDAQNQADWSY